MQIDGEHERLFENAAATPEQYADRPGALLSVADQSVDWSVLSLSAVVQRILHRSSQKVRRRPRPCPGHSANLPVSSLGL